MVNSYPRRRDPYTVLSLPTNKHPQHGQILGEKDVPWVDTACPAQEDIQVSDEARPTKWTELLQIRSSHLGTLIVKLALFAPHCQTVAGIAVPAAISEDAHQVTRSQWALDKESGLCPGGFVCIVLKPHQSDEKCITRSKLCSTEFGLHRGPQMSV